MLVFRKDDRSAVLSAIRARRNDHSMKIKIINAIFAEGTNHDFNKASRETIDTVVMYLTDQLNLVTV